MNVAGLDTPCLVVDRSKVAANAARLKERLASLHAPLRLHVKTVAEELPIFALIFAVPAAVALLARWMLL